MEGKNFNLDNNGDGNIENSEVKRFNQVLKDIEGLPEHKKEDLWQRMYNNPKYQEYTAKPMNELIQNMKNNIAGGKTLKDLDEYDINILQGYAVMFMKKTTKEIALDTMNITPEIEKIFMTILDKFKVTTTLDKQQSKQGVNIDTISKQNEIKLTNEQLNQTIENELSKLGTEFKERYDDTIKNKGHKYKMLWTILGKECQAQQGEYQGISGYWKFWDKFVNKDAIIYGSGNTIFDSNIKGFDTFSNSIYKDILKGDKEQANSKLDKINGLYDNLENQLRTVIHNDEKSGDTYLGAFNIDLSKTKEYQQKMEKSDYGVLDFMANVLKKPEYINYYMVENFDIKGENLHGKTINNILLNEDNDDAINNYFKQNKIIICGKEIKGNSNVDFADIIKDMRDKTKDTKLSDTEKVGVIKQKLLKNIMKNTNKDVKGNEIFDLYNANTGFMKDLERNRTGYAIKGTMVATACYGTLGIGDKLIGAGSGIKFLAGKFAMDIGIIHTTASAMGTIINGMELKDFGKQMIDIKSLGGTALFMGVFTGVGTILQRLGQTKLLTDIKQYKTGKIALSSVNFGTEIGTVIGVDNLVFDGEFTPEQLINTTIFIGMLKARKKSNDRYTVKSDGKGEIKITTEKEKGGETTTETKQETTTIPEQSKEKVDLKQLKQRIDNEVLQKLDLVDIVGKDRYQFLKDNYIDKEAEVTGKTILEKDFYDNGANGAIFNVPGKHWILKAPMIDAYKTEFVKEAKNQDDFNKHIRQWRDKYVSLLEFRDENKINRLEKYGKYIIIPKIHNIDTNTGLIVMDKIQNAISIDNIKYKSVLERDFGKELKEMNIKLDDLKFTQIKKLFDIMYEEHKMQKADIGKIDLSIISREQANTMIDLITFLDNIGVRHNDLHGGNILIGLENVPGKDFKPIYIIDFETAKFEGKSLEGLKITPQPDLKFDKNTDMDEFMGEYWGVIPENIIRIVDTLQMTVKE